MAYATIQDLRETFPNDALVAALADDDAAAARALAAADAAIDGYVGGLYTLPLAPVSGMLKDIACDLARFRLYDEAPSELIILRQRSAMDTLRDIARGVVRLPQADGAQPAPAGDAVASAGPARVFTADSMKGF